MKCKLTIFITCLFLFYIPTTATAVPLMVNGGFETGDFTGWNPHASPVFDGSITNTDAHSGTYSLQMGAVDWIDQSFSSVTTTGDLTYWAKGTGLSGPFNVRADYSDGTFSDATTGGASVPTDWTMFTFSIDNTLLLTKITISTWETLPILFDDFSLEGPGNDVVVPEPATILFFGLGILALAGINRKKFKI
jgi:hypothetical protein